MVTTSAGELLARGPYTIRGYYNAPEKNREAFTAEQRKAKFARLADKAGDYFEANSFRMAGNLRDGARAIVQQNLMNSIKSGWTAEQTRANIWDSLVSKGFMSRIYAHFASLENFGRLYRRALALAGNAGKGNREPSPGA